MAPATDECDVILGLESGKSKESFCKFNFKPLVLYVLVFWTFLIAIAGSGRAETSVGGYITADTTWDLSGSPYIVTSDVTLRPSGTTATLTIEAGVTITFEQGTGLYISGSSGRVPALVAQGTESEPIVFTSNAGSPAPGDWKGIYFGYYADDTASILEHCVVEYAGLTNGANIYAYESSPAIRNCTLRYSSGSGFRGYKNSSAIENCRIDENRSNGLYLDYYSAPQVTGCTITGNAGHGIYFQNSGSPVIKGNQISDCGHAGIYGTGGGTPVIGADNGNTISGCGTYCIYLDSEYTYAVASNNILSDWGTQSPAMRVGAATDFSGNTCSGTGLRRVELVGQNIQGTRTWSNALPEVVVLDTIQLKPSGTTATLTIEAGVTVKFDPGAGLYISGSYGGTSALVAQGTESEPIVFTSNTDCPAPGDWLGIYFADTADDDACLLAYCVVEYAGLTNNANVYASNSSPAIHNCTIRYSSGNGFRGYKNSSAIENCRIEENSSNGLYLDYYSAPQVTGCTIAGSAGHGIYFQNSGSPVIKGSQISDCGHAGIYGTGGGNPVIGADNGNTISGCGTYCIYLDSEYTYAVASNNTLSDWGAQSPAMRVGAGTDFSGNTYSGSGLRRIELVGQNILGNRTWSNALPEVVVLDTIQLKPSGTTATLTIEAGVTVKFDPGAGLYISGSYGGTSALVAQGTESEPIVFTSNTDCPAPGDWLGIYFADTADDDACLLAYCVVEYAGLTNNANVYASNSSPAIHNCTIRYSSGNGFRGYKNSSAIENCRIEENSSNGLYLDYYSAPQVTGCTIAGSAGHGIYFQNSGSPVIKGSQISDCGHAGIYGTGGGNPVIGADNGNTISGCGTYCIYLDSEYTYAVASNNTLSDWGAQSPAMRVGAGTDFSGNTYSGSGLRRIELVGQNILGNRTWSNALPEVVILDTTQLKPSGSLAILTIDPGVTVKFEPGTGLYITGSYGGTSALVARGTESEPIVFTSNADSPAPGDWRGIYFNSATDNDNSIMEHCLVEYGGYSNTANIWLYDAGPTLRYNTFRASSTYGVLFTGYGDSSNFYCNNIKENVYGVYVNTTSYHPVISSNHFIENKNWGLNTGPNASVTAENNWWNDTGGPNQSGDQALGNVDVDPWLTSHADCVDLPAENDPPFVPNNPTPAHNAVRVPASQDGQAIDVQLSWTGNDPNPWDTVTYDVYFGTDPDALTLNGQGLSTAEQSLSNLEAGATYYWKVTARDDAGAQTQGPVWTFTTLGDPPDLTVSAVSQEPQTGVVPKDMVSFPATISNNGAGPAVDAFTVEFTVDNAVIAAVEYDRIIPAGQSVEVSATWTAQAGEHTLEVTADSQDSVVESEEDNNTITVSLEDIIDPDPPEFTGSSPGDGDFVQSADQIVITLVDAHTKVDDTAVIQSFTVLDANSGAVAGTVLESNDKFTFVPDQALTDGLITVSFLAVDVEGNSGAHTFSFTLDQVAPGNLTITGGETVSGVLQVRPAGNLSDTLTITLTGTREDDTSVRINGETLAETGSGGWVVLLDLVSGLNSFEVFLTDRAGNQSETLWVDVTAQIPDAGINSGLVLYLPLDNDAADHSGYGNDAAMSGQMDWEDDRFGSRNTALAFDGQADSLEIPYASSLDVGDAQYAVSLWVKPDVQTGGEGWVYDSRGEGDYPYYARIRVNAPDALAPNGLYAGIFDGVNTIAFEETPIVNDGLWHHVVLTGDNRANVWKLYVDGALISTRTAMMDTLSASPDLAPGLALGRDQYNDSSPRYDGAIDELRVYNRVLELDDVQTLYNWDAPDIGSGLAVYYPFHGNADDESGNGVHAAVVQAQLTANVNGQSDEAYAFDGDGAAVGPESLVGASFPRDLTLAAWVRRDDISRTGSLLALGTGDAGSAVDHQFLLELDSSDTGGQVSFAMGNGDQDGYFHHHSGGADALINDQAWHHVAVTLQGQASLIYMDGQLSSIHLEAAGSRLIQEQFKLMVGARSGQDTFFSGDLDEVRIYNRSLSPAEIFLLADNTPLADITQLSVESYEDRLVFTWEPVSDPYGELSGYRISIDGQPESELIPPGDTQFEKTGLDRAAACNFTITSVDNSPLGNESTGISMTGYTLLENPGVHTVTPCSGYVTLAWDDALPAAYVAQYHVYVQESSFSSVADLTPVATVTETYAGISGLSDGTPYYFAVTAVNLSGGESKTVTSVSGTPLADTAGPEMGSLNLDGAVMENGQTLTTEGTIEVTVSDPAGVSRVEFAVDGEVLGTAYSTTSVVQWGIDPASLTDGSHTLTVTVYDTLGNSTTVSQDFTVALAAPVAPVIDQPVSGTLANTRQVTVKGSAPEGSEVILYINDEQTGSWQGVDTQGGFSFTADLTVQGENRIQAAARNRTGQGPLCDAVLVTLDTSIPESPTNPTAQSKAAGAVSLTWTRPQQGSIEGYYIFRSTAPFEDTAGAEQVNAQLVTGTTYEDLPAEDGTYYYRITAVSYAGSQGPASDQVAGISDREAPEALSIDYTPSGAFDPDTGRMAPGKVSVVLSVSETLGTTPFLSINSVGGVPLTVSLAQTGDTEYTGFFTIEDQTPDGTAYAIFSARDGAGNRGTGIGSGDQITIDTQGPRVIELIVEPGRPIKNDEEEPVLVQVTLGLDEALEDGTVPALSYLLSGTLRELVSIDTLTLVATRAGHAQTYQAQFSLPADAGLAEAETLTFTFSGNDDLGNVSDEIDCDNAFQVYQGDLPPLSAPAGLGATSLPGGEIRLSWNSVQDAAGYVLYRQAPDETQLTFYADCDLETGFTDAPAAEGLYTFAVASVREENGDSSQSGLSSQVSASSDATPPQPPKDLSLELISQGIEAAWQAPAGTEEITYSLYRCDEPGLLPVSGLDPVLTGISALTAIDTTPSQEAHYYLVTAVDEAGNESEPCDAVYLNFDLLPISDPAVILEDDSFPVLSWTHNGSTIEGYNLYVTLDSGEVKLNDGLMAATTYTDSGYTGDERLYRVLAVDHNGEESLARTIFLPVIEAALDGDSQVFRGLMNRLEYTVTNLSSTAVEPVRLKVALGGREHISTDVSIPAGASIVVPVTVGGYEDLSDLADLTLAIEFEPDTGERVSIIQNSRIQVLDGTFMLNIYNEEPVRGGSAMVHFTLENTSDETMEMITARDTGTAASDEVCFSLLDPEENVLSTACLHQATGTDVVTLTDGRTIVRLDPGQSFTSDEVALPVPDTCPDNAVLRLDIAQVHYALGTGQAVRMDGPAAVEDVSLADTAYYGTLRQVDPALSDGAQDIIIQGQAIERDSGSPMAFVPLRLEIDVSGFERTDTVITDSSGQFSYAFTPLSGESGDYTVRAMHPDLTGKPDQGTFTIARTLVSPETINISVPKNYEQGASVTVSTTKGVNLENVRLVYEPDDQPEGVFPEGIHLDIADTDTVDVTESSSAILDFTVWADNTALPESQLVLKAVSGEPDPTVLGSVAVTVAASDSAPVLAFSPNYLETGVTYGEPVTETITLSNTGYSELSGMGLSLTGSDGSDAPDWVLLNAAGDQGQLAVGESRDVFITFSPTTSVAEGVYPFYLNVESDNHAPFTINLFVTVTSSETGHALFKVEDMYTATIDDNGEMIQGLEGAVINLENVRVSGVTASLTTDELGEALFLDLSAGLYTYRITSADHQELSGRVWIKPGITASESIFLKNELITVEWSVEQTTVSDEYEIVVNATYETDVPAAVLVLTPSSVTLPDMEAGEVFTGELGVSNQGLIRADNIELYLPDNTENYAYEFLTDLPDSLGAKEQVVLPYRVVCRQSVYDSEDNGGGTSGSSGCITIHYDFVCSNGATFSYTVSTCFHNSISGSEISDGFSYGDDTTTAISNGQDNTGSSNVSAGPSSQGISGGVVCWPVAVRMEDQDPNASQDTGCSVNCFLGEYNDEAIDLSVKVVGGTIRVQRRFYDNEWHWEHLRHQLDFDLSINTFGYGTLGVKKAGVPYYNYELIEDLKTQRPYPEVHVSRSGQRAIASVKYYVSSSAPAVYVNGNYKITHFKGDYTLIPDTATVTGSYYHENNLVSGECYIWEDKYKNWKEFDLNGRMTAYGHKSGVTARLVYDNATGRLTAIADRHLNPVIAFEYDESGNVSAVRSTKGDSQVTYTYTNGLLTQITDVLGAETFYGYDDRGRLIRSVDAAGRSTYAAYNNSGFVSQVVDENGAGHFFDYDYNETDDEYYAQIRTTGGKIKELWFDAGGWAKQIRINGRTVMQAATADDLNVYWNHRYFYPGIDSYFAENEPVSMKGRRKLAFMDEKGAVTVKTFDEWGNLTRICYPDATAEQFIYDPTFFTITQYSNRRNMVTRFDYDDQGKLMEKTEAYGTDAQRTTTYAYDDEGQLSSVTIEGDGQTQSAIWLYSYTDSGATDAITHPEGGSFLMSGHDLTGNPGQVTDPLGNQWHIEYDKKGRPLSIEDPMGNRAAYEYDNANNITAFIDRRLNRYDMAYDPHNNLVTHIDPLSGKTALNYNTDNEATRITDPAGIEQNFTYDNEQRLLKASDASGTAVEYSYDETSDNFALSANPVSITFPAFTRVLTYDMFQRPIRVKDSQGDESRAVNYAYDANGNILSITDADGHQTTYAYDEHDRLASVTDASGNTARFFYDARNNLIGIMDPNENETTLAYDLTNRLTRLVRPEGGVIEFEYDAAGNQTAATDALGHKIEYEYDALNRLAGVKHFYADDLTTAVKTIRYTYDANGNLLSWEDETTHGTISGTFVYDELGRKIEESVDYGEFSLTHACAYYANGKKKSMTYPNGTLIEYTYDEAGRLARSGPVTYTGYQWNRPTHMRLAGGSQIELDYTAFMQPETITLKDPAANRLSTDAYEYSAAGNLVSRINDQRQSSFEYDGASRLISAQNADADDEAYTYDSAGNRLTASNTTGQWVYNGNNELISHSNGSYEYDARGNMVQQTVDGQITVFEYDIMNRLVKLSKEDGTVMAEYAYDPFGRRLWKEVNGIRTYFCYADEGLIGEYDESANLIRSYGYEPGSLWGTRPVFMKDSTQTYYYLTDHLGTPRQLVNPSGKVVWLATYDAFGNATIWNEEVENNLRLPGQYHDAESGLYYNWHRYYDPALGRYNRMDPLYSELNHYVYALNNPVRWTDPWGLCVDKPIDEMNNEELDALFNQMNDAWLSECRDNWLKTQRQIMALESFRSAIKGNETIQYANDAVDSIDTIVGIMGSIASVFAGNFQAPPPPGTPGVYETIRTWADVGYNTYIKYLRWKQSNYKRWLNDG